jgi:hypothetical protein
MENDPFLSHFFEVWEQDDLSITNPQEIFTNLITIPENCSIYSSISLPNISNFIQKILYEFEMASISNFIGDAYLFFKFFTEMLFKAISIHALLRGVSQWLTPPNYLKQMGNEVEKKFLCSLFPDINQEFGNKNKSDFIDWFNVLLDEVEESKIPLEIPVSFDDIKRFLHRIYRRDYLINFRPIEFTQLLFRSPNPASFLGEEDLLERYLLDRNITLIIDLRGEQEARHGNYIDKLLDKHQIQSLIVDFNEPKISEITASSYVRKLYYLKPVVKEIFDAILKNDGATLIHCASGKDRTGVVSCLLQKLIGVDDDKILEEYHRSGLDTRTEKMIDVLKFIEDQGGIQMYLEKCGFLSNDQENLISKIRL